MKRTDKYNSFSINDIILDPNCKMEELIPSSFTHSGFLFFLFNTTYIVVRNIISVLFFAPLKYKFSGVKSYSKLYDSSILFILPSLNNQRALSKVIEELTVAHSNVKVINGVLEYAFYPRLLIDLYSLIKLPRLWLDFRRFKLRERKLLCYNSMHFVFTPGVVWFYRKMLTIEKPKCVVFANDHIFFTKSLELLCEDFGVPSIYVQHASVSYDFPELHFSFSFLDGFDSFVKYTSKGKVVNGKVIVLGAARYDSLGSYKATRKKGLRNCIGIAINELDDNKIVNTFCNSMLNYYPDIKIKMRAHPAMKNKPFVLDNKERIIYTCASDESMIDYLDSIDLQISGDSGVHFDSILGGVRTIAYNLSNYKYGDNYEYVRSGMISLASNEEEIFRFIKDENYNPNDFSVVRRFDESYGKSYAGQCSHIIADFILHDLDLSYLRNYYKMQKLSYDSISYLVIPS